MRKTIRLTPLIILLTLGAAPLSAQSRQGQVNAELRSLKDAGVKACSLLTNDEIREATGRNDSWELTDPPYDQNSLCDFSGVVTIRLYAGDTGLASIDALLKNYEITDERMPISGFGDGAFLMYPTPRDEYADTAALLVGRAGQRVFMMTLNAPYGGTAESVRPQLLELATIVMSRLQ